ncbi:MAG: hypothetical protein AB7N91_01185 [Candidatus Tectimicrobiota bacterium]
MDPQAIATTAVTVLAPYLAKAGEKAVEEVGKKLPESVGKLWRSITARVAGKPAAAEAIKDLAATPGDGDNQAAFRKELRKLLETDSAFAVELVSLLHMAQREHNGPISNSGSGAVATGSSVAAGAGGVAIGGNVSGGMIVTHPERRG